MAPQTRELKVGTVPSWMEYAGCMYHVYPCDGMSTYCIPTFKMRKTYVAKWRKTWRNSKMRGCWP